MPKDESVTPSQLAFLVVGLTAAACQGIKWHMWLYYYPHFLRELIDIYDDTGDEIDRTAEWPTRGAYLIYSIVSNLIDWIEIGEDLPPNSTHLVIESVLPNHENGNIPKSAVLALGRCVGLFVVAENAGYRFRAYLFSMVVRLIGRCAVDGDRSDLRRALINSIVNRGSLGREIVYGEKLKLLFDGVDYILKSDVPDFFEAITAAYGE
jgi:hypothetical protein